MSDKAPLPSEITQGATLRGNEYGWTISSFPDAIAKAQTLGYACLNGQFQFRLDDATCEVYWLSPGSKDRAPGESWSDYSRRSCSEVLKGFQHLIAISDFIKEASGWPSIPIDPAKHLVFVAYFVTEADLADLAQQASAV
jgi:hypothetical protein